MKRNFWIVLCLLAVAGAWLFWPRGGAPSMLSKPAAATVAPAVANTAASRTVSVAEDSGVPSAACTNRLAFRLANTPKSVGQLTSDRHAILLENAFIDTSAKAALNIPSHLRAAGDPGAFIVQARGVIDSAFRAQLAQAGAQIVSYIPNNAYLVRLSPAGAAGLAANARVQAVLPYEPYYKISASMPVAAKQTTASVTPGGISEPPAPTLLELALKQKPLPAGTYLTLGLFGDGAAATEAQLVKLGAEIVARDRSPFGPIVRVRPPADWLALAQLPGVQLVEPAHRRVSENDLSRKNTGVAVDSISPTNYLNLYGSNVLVEVNDTGVDTNHPDLTGRVLFDFSGSGYDTDGHGTFVAGEIAGDGTKSLTVTNAQGSIMPGTNGQFRGKAPLARLFSVGGVDGGNDTNLYNPGDFPDSYFQEIPARTNALISNNSWNNGGVADYDLSAASYDAAVRDALPGVTGPQPVLFVFSAGNDGGGNDFGQGGNSDSILSPGTAKNVITVGSLEEYRNITNTYLPHDSTNPVVAWQAETDSRSQVAGYSARGNVGIGTEGTYGRFKPDVVAPGTFVVSTRSTTWDTAAYYNPTNYHFNTDNTGQMVDTNILGFYQMPVPDNAVGIILRVVPNSLSPRPFPNLQFYLTSTDGSNLDPADPGSFDYMAITNTVAIPPDGPGGYLQTLITSGQLSFLIADPTNVAIPVNFDLIMETITTNDNGNYLTVLSNLNETIGPFYRYETGTSIAAADVSGVLALMQDFFTNTLHTTPSPVLLKALLINGARVAGSYGYAVTNGLNLQGWGLINLPNSIPAALTNTAAGTNTALFFVDQNPTNALATGDSQTFNITVPPASQGLPLRITLAWTDPPGNPAAALKLVNNLDLVVTNLATGRVYYGNNFAPSDPPYSVASRTNDLPNLDSVNNVENIVIPPALGTNYSVTIVGRSVNVNAVTTEPTNIVQDFALVIACADYGNTNGIAVAANPPVPSLMPQIAGVGGTNGIFFDQIAGASAPLLSTNYIVFGTNTPFAANAVLALGQTNQWHFYIVTNTTSFTNAAFITFIPNTLAIPRKGVFAGTDANSTRPEADLDLYVATPNDPDAASLTNLSPVVVSNCVFGKFGDGAALDRGGTEFVAYTNAANVTSGNNVYYVGVKCEDQMAGQYGFLAVFSETPFSTQDTNGNVYVNGLSLPVNIPDGNNRSSGVGYVFGLAIQPIELRAVIVTNTVTHQNFGDLLGFLSHDDAFTTLNSHDSLGVVVNRTLIYDDSGQGGVTGSIASDGPGTLKNFTGKQGIGLWMLTELDDAQYHTGRVDNLTIKLEPHVARNKTGVTEVIVPAGGWFYDYVDVPVGYTNITVFGIDDTLPYPSPILLALQFNTDPTLSNNLAIVGLTNGPLQNTNFISYGPPLTPGRYYVGLYNPDTLNDHMVWLGVTLAFSAAAETTVDYASTGPVPLLDDAVTYDTITVTNTDLIGGFNVGLRVDHDRISDLVFHLISPDGTRYLLMENRGANSTNGCGATVIMTNIFNATANGTAQPNTNYINVGTTSGILPITYNFYTAPDEMTIYYGTNIIPANVIYDTGVTNNPSLGGGAQNTATVTINVPYGPTNGIVSTYLTIVMDEFPTNFPGGTNRSDFWTYTAGSVSTNFEYLTFTEDPNLTTTPIKFAPPPLVPPAFISTNFTLSDFELAAAGDYVSPSVVNGWTVISNQVSVIADAANAQGGSNYLALANGMISNSIPTIPGLQYTLSYYYRGPGIAGWWRGESNAKDSINGNNGTIPNGMGYAAGEVGSSFNLNGIKQYVLVNPTKSALDVGQDTGFTIEGWVKPQTFTKNQPFLEYEKKLGTFSGSDVGVNLYAYLVGTSGGLYANFTDTSGGSHTLTPSAVQVKTGVWQHIAFSYSKATGMGTIYLNGTVVAQQNLGNFTPQTSFTNFLIGGRTTFGSVASPSDKFTGGMDEIGVYNRALSDGEVNAIYVAGAAGKFDATVFNTSSASSLAEASVTIPGVTNYSIVGDNLNWHQQTTTFTASQTSTPIVISGIEPGMLLDTFTVSGFNNPKLYYLAEQSLDPLIGTSAYGDWQLEVLDNRAGATNNATLVSWQLEFIFANTNLPVASSAVVTPVSGGIPQTNTTATAGNITWYSITVPSTASFATNRLLFASAAVNVWFSTNYPPTTTNSGDVDLIPGSTSGSALLGTNGSLVNTSSAYIVPGATYYLGVQNSNAFTVTNAVEVDFDQGNSATPHLVFSSVKISGGNLQLSWSATSGGQYQIQWKDSLTDPWNTIIYPATTATDDGVSTFTDDGTQSAPLGQMRFYRLVWVP